MADKMETAPDPPGIISNSEDAAMAAARKELKHTVISEEARTHPDDGDASAPDSTTDTSKDASIVQESPSSDNIIHDDSGHTDASGVIPKQGLASPKKKRRYDQVDKDKDADDSDVHSESSSGSRDRALRSEPEKKRARDEVAPTCSSNGSEPAPKSPTAAGDKSLSKITSSEAFAGSGFAKLSSSQSPFGSLAGTSQPSLFSNAAPALPPSKPSLTFTGSASSPFTTLSSDMPSSLKSGFGGFGGFSALSSTTPLSTFAKPGEAFKSDKPSKPFGAPESESGDEDEDGRSDTDSSPDEAGKTEKSEDKDHEGKRHRLQKVDIDDGEAGEVTVLQVRAKMFYLDKVSGWKERGAGMLKINVPSSSIQFDAAGSPIAGSFNASLLEADAAKVPRLILRQDQTHRVLLNTAILSSAEFQEKTTLRATTILFTALGGDDAKPFAVTMKMSAANAKSFLAEVGNIQQELRAS